MPKIKKVKNEEDDTEKDEVVIDENGEPVAT